jgi:hypothetical protein
MKNVTHGLVAISLIVFVGLGCSALRDLAKTENSNKPGNSSGANNAATTNSTNSANTSIPADAEPADFTMTSEQLDGEFTKKGAKAADLEKYSNKNIAVTGRVTMLVPEKKGTTQPWVTLFAPGLGHGVSCYFDDENVGQMSMLKDDKIVKVQGFQDDFIVPEVSPMLKHCSRSRGVK